MPGSQKLLLDIDGTPMVRHVTTAASEGGCHQTVVVYSSNEVKQALDGVELVHNAQARTGMASSLQVGLKAMRPEIQAAVVLLGDQPLVGSRTIIALLRAWRREGSRPAVAVSQGDKEWAPPVVLSRELWPELFALKGDAGARQILHGRPELLDMVPAPGRPDDIDTPDDYAKIVRLFPHRKPRQRA
jgi:CTP:molybdopterin cytidylyltransferase MocA